MMPFDVYPHQGRRQLGILSGDNCRHEYGLKLQKLTSLNACAYCSLSLVDTYDHWLMMSVDHVVPRHGGEELGISPEWLDDYWNMVLCCSACDGFGNPFILTPHTKCPTTVEDFLTLRDHVFIERKRTILLSHEKELDFYDKKPWEL